MKPGDKAYQPTSVDKAIQHAKKEQAKKWRPQKWKDWLDEDDDTTEAKPDETEKKAS